MSKARNGYIIVGEIGCMYHMTLRYDRMYLQNYEEVCHYKNGFAKVRNGKHWWHINSNGEKIYTTAFDEITNFKKVGTSAAVARAILNNIDYRIVYYSGGKCIVERVV